MEDMPTNEVDPRFFLPPGVVDLGYADGTQASSDAPVQDGADEIQMEVTETDPNILAPEDAIYSDENALYPPDNVTVVSQTVRVTSGGAVVDVVIDVDDTPGITQYDVRLTK